LLLFADALYLIVVNKMSVSLPILETILSGQSTVLELTNKNKETKHYIHPKHKKETQKAALDEKKTRKMLNNSR